MAVVAGIGWKYDKYAPWALTLNSYLIKKQLNYSFKTIVINKKSSQWSEDMLDGYFIYYTISFE